MSKLVPSPPPACPTLPSTAPAGANLADLSARLKEADVPPELRNALRSSINATARLAGLPPSGVIASLRDLFRRLDRVCPAQHDISPKRLANIRSDLRRAFHLVGWKPRANRNTFTPAWTALASRLPNEHKKAALSRFMRYCSERGIEPDGVDDAVAQAYQREIEEVDYCRRPQVAFRDTVRVWNAMVGVIEGWPAVTLTRPDHSRTWALTWNELPVSLRDDTEAWLARMAGKRPPGGPDGARRPSRFSDPMPGKPVSAQTVHTRRHQVRTWASALVRGGRAAGTLRSLADLVTIGAFDEAVTYLETAEHGRSAETVHQIAICMVLVAKHWVKVPAADLARISAGVATLKPRRTDDRLTEKVETILNQFDGPAALRTLAGLPDKIAAGLETVAAPGVREARRMEMAVAIELLLRTAMRRANVAGLRWEGHFLGLEGGAGTARLIVPGEEVKNGRDLAFPISDHTLRLLMLYRQRYWPLLADAGCQHLFPRRGDGALSGHQFSKRVKAFIQRETGLIMTPHVFRHLAVTLLQRAEPGNQESGRQLLGHTTSETTQRHYARSQRERHIATYDRVIDDLQSGARGVMKEGR